MVRLRNSNTISGMRPESQPSIPANSPIARGSFCSVMFSWIAATAFRQREARTHPENTRTTSLLCLPAVVEALAVLVITIWSSTCAAQAPFLPSSWFGSLPLPDPDVRQEIGLVVNRFTNTAKPSDVSWQGRPPAACSSYEGRRGRTCDYVLQRMIGLNTVYWHQGFRVPRLRTTARVGLQIGNTSDNPSRFLQNDFLHQSESIDRVPVDTLRIYRSWQAGATVSATKWIDVGTVANSRTAFIAPFFLGTAVDLGTIARAWTVEAGVRGATTRLRGLNLPAVSAMIRKSLWLRSGLALGGVHRGPADELPEPVFPQSTSSAQSSIARNVTQSAVSIVVPLNKWFGPSAILPSVEYGITRSDAFLIRPGPSEIEQVAAGRELRAKERFYTVSLRWAGGDYGFETWNDSLGNKDQGPTFGVRVFLRGW
jgi:hypothetical protein